MTAIFPSSFGISSSSLSVEPSVSGSEAGIRLQWNDHRRPQVAFADERKRVELFRDYVSRSGFHNCAGAAGVTAKPDLLNQTGRVEATYHLELRLPEVCGSRGFPLIGMPGEQSHELHFERSLSLYQHMLAFGTIAAYAYKSRRRSSHGVDTSICLCLGRYQHMLTTQDGVSWSRLSE